MVGALFFVTAIFATLTSCISVLESITANCVEIFHWERKKAVRILPVIYLAASAVIALGYSVFYFEAQLPNGSAAHLCPPFHGRHGADRLQRRGGRH